MVIDIGTGSGSAVLRRAAREPGTLFVALDADTGAMADASRRAARLPRRGGRPNVIFLAAAAESLPDALWGLADEITVVLPWGTLLDAVIDPASRVFAGIAACMTERGELTILISAIERDGLPGLGALEAAAAQTLVARYRECGFPATTYSAATRADVERLSSGWGRRLGIPERRQAWVYTLRSWRVECKRSE